MEKMHLLRRNSVNCVPHDCYVQKVDAHDLNDQSHKFVTNFSISFLRESALFKRKYSWELLRIRASQSRVIVSEYYFN